MLRNKLKREFAFSLLSVLLSVLIPLAPVNFSFCTNLYPAPSLCLSQTLKGIALGHSVSLLLLSALSIPLLHSPCLRGCWFNLLFSVYQPLPLLQHYHWQCQISSSCAVECSQLRVDRVTVGGSDVRLKYKYHRMLWACSKCRCHLHLAEWVTMSNREEVQCLAQGQFDGTWSSWWAHWLSSMQTLKA